MADQPQLPTTSPRAVLRAAAADRLRGAGGGGQRAAGLHHPVPLTGDGGGDWRAEIRDGAMHVRAAAARPTSRSPSASTTGATPCSAATAPRSA